MNINYVINRVPVFLFLTIVVYDLVVTTIDFNDELYLTIYYVASESIGASFVLNLFMLLICFRLKLCWYNKVSVYGLLALNLVNFTAMTPLLDYELYYNIVTHIVMIPTAMLATILLIKKI
jgi:hypothetical protein